ncbi:transcriptional regulator [Winkia sp. UMB3158]|uniref:Transcriptional regulator n=1 Tax=Winkia neuii subsp. anitrata TaxID=29318 RepID=A0AB38XR46_9ACTO|nr:MULTISPECIES: MerR family transcriptional regulator [Actinomycetaceae]MDK8341228.1 transcriptional regulator [Winkia sp. UMB3164B]MDK6240182.1 transcriptional regulator [Winkia sp. UMB10116]MDK7143526.1 transcriptional regulator [Gleimia europaea]MDK7148583.1 transcriptional regulator [Winkia sp. UMB3158]MDK7163167.1 transcriptional regulator [Winkia sp. UMB3105]
MSKQYLSVSDVAALAGVTVGTLRSYVYKGMLPEPEVLVGLETQARGWSEESIRHWLANRPGRGRRTPPA